jgi:outer membrane lipoprotein-sorting protein
MISMTADINRNNFEGRREVTCNSCHRGSTHPSGVPAVATAERDTEKVVSRPVPVDPSVDQVLNRYVAALGGASAIRRITSRVEKGTVNIAGRLFPIEIYAKVPDQLLSIMHFPSNDNVYGFNGATGWQSNPTSGVRLMSPSEVIQSRFESEFYFPLRIRELYDDISVVSDKDSGAVAEDRGVVVLVARRSGTPPVRLQFNRESGLLMRAIGYTETPLGRIPLQIDYDDYRESSGVKIPFRWTTSTPGGRFTVELKQVQQNIPIDDTKFAPPAAAHSGPS